MLLLDREKVIWQQFVSIMPGIQEFVGKNMSMTYDFQKLTIDIPKAEGPGGKHIGSVQWAINGRIIITTEAYDKTNQGKK